MGGSKTGADALRTGSSGTGAGTGSVKTGFSATGLITGAGMATGSSSMAVATFSLMVPREGSGGSSGSSFFEVLVSLERAGSSSVKEEGEEGEETGA